MPTQSPDLHDLCASKAPDLLHKDNQAGREDKPRHSDGVQEMEVEVDAGSDVNAGQEVVLEVDAGPEVNSVQALEVDGGRDLIAGRGWR
jgi:hypothetical protein